MNHYKLLTLSAFTLALTACGGSSGGSSGASSSAVAQSSVAQSSVAQSSVAQSSAAQSSVAQSSVAQSSTAQSSVSQVSSEAAVSSEASSSSEGTTDGLSFYLYNQGPGTFTFDVNGAQVTNTLTPGEFNPQGSIQSNAGGTGSGGETVWDINFTGDQGNVFLTAQDMSQVEGLETGLGLENMLEDGAVNFEIFVIAQGEQTELHIKLDSGWPNVSYFVIDNPTVGEWTSVSIPVADFMPNNIQAGVANLDNLLNIFVLEAVGGTAHVQLKNIYLSCPENCAVVPVYTPEYEPVDPGVLVVLENGLSDSWPDLAVGLYQHEGNLLAWEWVTDNERGQVLEFTFSGPNFGTMYLQGQSRDLSAFAGGTLEFDFRVVERADNTAGFRVKIDCGYPCGSAEIPVALPGNDEWTSISLPLTSFTSSGLIITQVNTPISFFPVLEQQTGVIMQLDRVRWVAPE